MPDTHHIPPDSLERAAFEIFKASGSPEAEARLIASRLLKSNLAGHDSHGVIRIPFYMRLLRDGIIKAGAEVEIVKDNGATVLVDGHWGYGQSAMEQTSHIAIERAQEHGISAVGVTHLLHIGRLADYAITAANAGLIGIVSTSAGGVGQKVTPFGGIAARIATNPFAAAFPGGAYAPVVFDMATSTVAEGKVQVMRDGKLEAPENILIDKEGNPTRNPLDLYEGGAILPVGGAKGYKGYLMAFMVEVLAGLLTGGGFVGKEEDPAFNNCTFMICIDVESFRPLDTFKGEIDRLIDYLKATPARPGEGVLYPGEVEARKEEERRRTGIPLADTTVKNLQQEMDTLGIPIRLEAQAVAPTPQS